MKIQSIINIYSMEKKIHGNIHKLYHHLLLDPKFMLLSLF